MAKKYQVIGTPFDGLNIEEVKTALETRIGEVETALEEKVNRVEIQETVEKAVDDVLNSSSGSGEDVNAEIDSWF